VNAFADPWPENVRARYLTVAGATVDLSRATAEGRGSWFVVSRCLGCDASSNVTPAESAARHWAQSHAEVCRALPRPRTGH
jgi:hypothetical protein